MVIRAETQDVAWGVTAGTPAQRGRFILRKLQGYDAARFGQVMATLSRDVTKDPAAITKAEWRTILGFLGASPHEVSEVLKRIGRVWR